MGENPEEIPSEYHNAVLKNVIYSINQQLQLRNMNENYQASEMNNRIIEMNGDIPGSEWAAFKEEVSPLTESKLRSFLLTTQASAQKKQNDTAKAIRNLTSSENFSENSEDQSYNALNELASQKIQRAKSKGKSLFINEAQMQVAATAAGPIKKYIDKLNTKAASGNPVDLQEVKASIEYIEKAKAWQNLKGTTDDTYSVIAKYDSLGETTDPVTRAQIAKQIVYDKNEAQIKANDAGWKNFLNVMTKKDRPMPSLLYHKLTLNLVLLSM